MKKVNRFIIAILVSYVFYWTVIVYRIKFMFDINTLFILGSSIFLPLIGYAISLLSDRIRTKKHSPAFISKNNELLSLISPILIVLFGTLSFHYAHVDNSVYLITSLMTVYFVTRFINNLKLTSIDF